MNEWLKFGIEIILKKLINYERTIEMKKCHENIDDFINYYEKTDHFIDDKFFLQYVENLQKMDFLVDCAKIYIYKNYEKIKDWSELTVYIRSKNNGNVSFSNIDWIDIEDIYNPVSSITDVVIDTSDGDFSLTINDVIYTQINDESIITIAYNK
jgi:hypothetical protein